MGSYINADDITSYTGVEYTSTSSPTLNQINAYILSGESDFEKECGVFKSTIFSNVIVDGCSFGFFLSDYVPLLTITAIEQNLGDDFTPIWSSSDIDYYIDDADIGKVVVSNPFIGHRLYRVSGTSGYSSIPQNIKDIVMLYVWRQIFQNEFFSKKGASVTETVDVKVYKEVTNGGSLSKGLDDLDSLISKRKSNLQKGYITRLI